MLQGNERPGLQETDKAFGFLRLLTILSSAGWLVLSPLPMEEKFFLTLLLVGFILYSVILYVLILSSPHRVRQYYRFTFFVDLGFILALVGITGGIKSEFYLALYVLAALHSFYFGLFQGVGGATAISLLYLGLILLLRNGSIHWTYVAMRIAFLLVIALFLGLLSEREKREREKIQALNLELERKNIHLQRAHAELKETQEQVLQTEKMAALGTFVSGVAHEINNPAGIILSRIEVMLMDAQEKGLPSDILHDLKVVEKHVRRIADIAGHLLTFSRRSTPEFSEVKVNEIIQEIRMLLEKQLKKEKITLNLSLESHLPVLYGDSNQVEQVIVNIMNNARDAMPNGGTLDLITSVREANGKQYVRVAIRDTGTGIPPEQMKRIFDPFFTTKERGKGTGLGLSVSYSIIKEHGGTIEVESEVSKGTTFTMTLPVK